MSEEIKEWTTNCKELQKIKAQIVERHMMEVQRACDVVIDEFGKLFDRAALFAKARGVDDQLYELHLAAELASHLVCAGEITETTPIVVRFDVSQSKAKFVSIVVLVPHEYRVE